MLICHIFFDISNFLSLIYQLHLILVTLQTFFWIFAHNSCLLDVDLGSTSYLDVFCPLSIWHWEVGHLVEAVSGRNLWSAPLALPTLSCGNSCLPFCCATNCSWSPVLASKGFYLGSTKAQFRRKYWWKRVQSAPQTPKVTDDSWGVCLLPRHFLPKG